MASVEVFLEIYRHRLKMGGPSGLKRVVDGLVEKRLILLYG